MDEFSDDFYKQGYLEGGSGKSVEVYRIKGIFYIDSKMAANPGLRKVELTKDDQTSCEFRFAPVRE